MKAHSQVRKWLITALTFTMIFPILAACTNNTNQESKQEQVLRIGVVYGGFDDSYFRQQFTDAYELTHKNVKIEIVPAINYMDQQFEEPDENGVRKEPDRLEAIKKIMEGDNPVDVVVTDVSQFRSLARDGLLTSLDPRIQQDQLNTEDFVPAVIDGLKNMGDGTLYGLSPTFMSSVILYNKKIFQEAGVEPPTDNMTWDDLFNLARRVSKGEGKDRVFGFNFERYPNDNGFNALMTNFTDPLNLRFVDEKKEKLLVNSPQWERSWSQITKLINEKIIPSSEDMNTVYDEKSTPGPYDYDFFISGRLAMVVGDYGYINGDLTNVMKNAAKIKNFKPFEWDVVTIPSHPEAEGVSGYVQLSNIFSINQKAANPEIAWDFIQYLNGEDWSKLRSRSSYEMVSRKSFIKPPTGSSYNIEAFYKVKPSTPTGASMNDLMMENPNMWQVSEVGRNLFTEVTKNSKTIAEALKEWETKGNELLQQIKNSPDGGVGIMPGIYGG